MDVPTVSVVVATKNRQAQLPALFEALTNQDLAVTRFEIVIVDDGSTDDTPAVVAGLRENAPFDVTYVRLDTSRGPAKARDIGVAQARAATVAFTDDDCLPVPSWLSTGTEALTDDIGVVVGRVRPPPGDVPGPYSRAMVASDARFMATANVFYRRDDYLAVGGFSSSYRRPGGEDLDLGLRVLELGRRAVFAPDALVFHPTTPDRLSVALRIAWRWVDIPLTLKRHPSIRRDYTVARVFWKPSHIHALAAFVGLGGVALTPWFAVSVLPYVWFRLRRQPRAHGLRARLRTLPGLWLVDMTEVLAVVRGSVQHRTLLL